MIRARWLYFTARCATAIAAGPNTATSTVTGPCFPTLGAVRRRRHPPLARSLFRACVARSVFVMVRGCAACVPLRVPLRGVPARCLLRGVLQPRRGVLAVSSTAVPAFASASRFVGVPFPPAVPSWRFVWVLPFGCSPGGSQRRSCCQAVRVFASTRGASAAGTTERWRCGGRPRRSARRRRSSGGSPATSISGC